MSKGFKKKYGKNVRFTVYDNRTDMPIIVCGTNTQCAIAMGISLNAFYALTCNRQEKNIGSRWFIVKEMLSDDELDEYNGGEI